MKKLLFILMLAAWSSGHASEWLEATNEAGGKIILTNTLCIGKTEGRLVIAVSSTGRNINGCWYHFAKMIHVVWSDGTTYSYEPEVFKYKKD